MSESEQLLPQRPELPFLFENIWPLHLTFGAIVLHRHHSLKHHRINKLPDWDQNKPTLGIVVGALKAQALPGNLLTTS